MPSLLVGVALGNVIRGVPMDAQGNYIGTFWELLNPYSLLVGVTGLFLSSSTAPPGSTSSRRAPCTPAPSGTGA